MPDLYARRAFEPHENTVFRVKPEGGEAVDLVLKEVRDERRPGREPQGEQFSLLFEGPPETFLPQQTYPMEHPEMGSLALFLVPVGQTRDGFQYEAYFNRMAPAP